MKVKKTYERPVAIVVKCAPVEIICASAGVNNFDMNDEVEE